LYFSLFHHVFYRITFIGWSALAVVSRYCQILLLLLSLLLLLWRTSCSETLDNKCTARKPVLGQTGHDSYERGLNIT